MKKLYLSAVTALILLLGACEDAERGQPSEPVNLAGWITFSDGTLYLDEARVYVQAFAPTEYFPDGLFFQHAGENVIVFAPNDTEKLYKFGFYKDGHYEGYFRADGTAGTRWVDRREYGIFPNGYLVKPLSRDIISFELTEETVFTFTDVALLFVDGEAVPTRRYYTTVLEEFLTHRASVDTVIVFIQIQNGRVVSVTEEFLFTQ